MIKKTFEQLVADISRGQIEIYNEFSLQHEVGLLLREEYPRDKVQFERNISYFFNRGEFIKKEIDIAVFSPDKTELRYAIELKFPRNGQHPEQMFSFCKDILFAEQLKASGFQRTFLIIFADDKLFFSGNGDGIYGYFRQQKQLHGNINKPTGNKDETIKLKGTYQVNWRAASEYLKYTIIEASNGQQKNQLGQV
jgi:hypothetical protein